jgi:anthranilate phosphoribosyltransferase
VARAELLDPMADALRRLGLVRAVVVHGHGGLDEASLSGPNELRLVENGEMRTEFVDPWELGLSRAGADELKGGDVATNARILEQVLRGQGSNAQRDVVALNTALVLWAAGQSASVAEGLERSAEALASGTPWARLDMLREALAAPSMGDAGG